jgi:hypothetical protein
VCRPCQAREAVQALLAQPPDDVIAILTGGMSQWLDLSLFSGRWNVPAEAEQCTTGEGT